MSLLFLALLLPAVEAAERNAVIDRLGSPVWRVRQDAHDELARRGVLVLPALRGREDDPDPEIRRRVGQLIETAHGSVCDGPFPWIDQLPDDYPNRQQIIDRWLGKVRVPGWWADQLEDWPEWRTATMLFCRHLLDSGASACEVRKLIGKMKVKEREYRRARGMGEPEPISMPKEVPKEQKK